jgi:hypothetical protein
MVMKLKIESVITTDGNIPAEEKYKVVSDIWI